MVSHPKFPLDETILFRSVVKAVRHFGTTRKSTPDLVTSFVSSHLRSGDTMAAPIWPSWSPDLCPGRTKIPRRYVQIPLEQKKLLERQDAWSASGLPNVPSSVLEAVSASHVMTTKVPSHVERRALPPNRPRSRGDHGVTSPLSASLAREMREDLQSQPVSPVSAPRGALCQPPASSAPRTPVQTGREGNAVGERELTCTPMSWSPSPTAHLRPIRPPIAPATATRPAPSRPTSGRPDLCATSLAVSPAMHVADLPPSSSAASETGLEIEVPKAINDVLGPVNRLAVPVLEPTPPSAQIIPCTITERTSPVQVPEAKRRRLMKKPDAVFANTSPDGQKHALRLKLPTTGPAPSTRSSSPAVVSSPLTPRALVVHTVEASPVRSIVGDGGLLTAANQLGIVASNHLFTSSVDKLPPNGPPSQVPFTAFTLTYPDYQGSLGDFIRGVICVLQLQKERAIPEFLYDDFIRVFATGYLQYVDTLSDDEPPLRAIEWYNENVPRPLYTKCILTRSNIKEVPTQYPEKYREIQQQLHNPKTDTDTGVAGEAVDAVRGGQHEVQQHVAETRPAGLSWQDAVMSESLASHAAAPSHARLGQPGIQAVARSAKNVPIPSPGLSHRPNVVVAAQDRNPEQTAPARGLAQNQAASSSAAVAISQSPEVANTKRRMIHTPPSNAQRQGQIFTGDAAEQPGALRAVEDEESRAAVFPVFGAVGASNNSARRSGNGLGLSQFSNADSIPEAATKRKLAPRASAGSSAGEPGVAFKRPRRETEDPEVRLRRWKQFLNRKKTQGSLPSSSAAG